MISLTLVFDLSSGKIPRPSVAVKLAFTPSIDELLAVGKTLGAPAMDLLGAVDQHNTEPLFACLQDLLARALKYGGDTVVTHPSNGIFDAEQLGQTISLLLAHSIPSLTKTSFFSSLRDLR